MFEIVPFGEQALILRSQKRDRKESGEWIRSLAALIEADPQPGVTDLIPSVTELVICYDVTQTNRKQLEERLHALESRIAKRREPKSAEIVIPICYGGAGGPDLEEVARRVGLDPDEVAALHASRVYRVEMMGFMPGFVYLSGLDSTLKLPRKGTPSPRLAAGTVGIAGEQSCIYPMVSPGGWHRIGRTPVQLFDPVRTSPTLLKPGDTVTFEKISETELRLMEEQLRKRGEDAAD